MPGTVTVVAVREGQLVSRGQKLVVIEAMKMEHVLAAPADGVVVALRARVGESVRKGDVLVGIEAVPSRDVDSDG